MAIISERMTLSKVQAMEKQLQQAQKAAQVAQAVQAGGKDQAANQKAIENVPQLVVAAQPQITSFSPQESNTGFFGSFFSGKKNSKQIIPKMEAPPANLKATGSLSEREKMETEVIKLLLESYFSIVKRTVCDMVPKAIMLNLVNYTKDNMQKELLSTLYRNQSLRDSMKESEYVINRRNECKKMIDVLQQAENAIANV